MKKTKERKQLVTSETIASFVHILSYDKGQISGFFYNPHFEKGASFSSELELIQCMHSWMNESCFPQSTVQYRSFRKKVGRSKSESVWELSELEAGPSEAIGNATNSLASFWVRVQFRQHATWQGSIQWEGQPGCAYFHSALEFFLLIANALQPGTEPPAWQS